MFYFLLGEVMGKIYAMQERHCNKIVAEDIVSSYNEYYEKVCNILSQKDNISYYDEDILAETFGDGDTEQDWYEGKGWYDCGHGEYEYIFNDGCESCQFGDKIYNFIEVII